MGLANSSLISLSAFGYVVINLLFMFNTNIIHNNRKEQITTTQPIITVYFFLFLF